MQVQVQVQVQHCSGGATAQPQALDSQVVCRVQALAPLVVACQSGQARYLQGYLMPPPYYQTSVAGNLAARYLPHSQSLLGLAAAGGSAH